MHKVGDTVWVFDRNLRKYNYGPDGRAVGGPIFRKHFRPVAIAGETSRSWILAGGPKVPKTGGDVRDYSNGAYGKVPVYMTQQAVDDAVFMNEHRWRIYKAVEACPDVAILRQVAALVGYKAAK